MPLLKQLTLKQLSSLGAPTSQTSARFLQNRRCYPVVLPKSDKPSRQTSNRMYLWSSFLIGSRQTIAWLTLEQPLSTVTQSQHVRATQRSTNPTHSQKNTPTHCKLNVSPMSPTKTFSSGGRLELNTGATKRQAAAGCGASGCAGSSPFGLWIRVL